MTAGSKRYLMIQFSSSDPSWIDVLGEMEKRRAELEESIIELEEAINMHTWAIADKRQRLAELDEAIATCRIV